METVIEKVRQFERKAWQPVTEERDGELTDSKFSGKPWLSGTESWPSCGVCGKEMQLFVQLNLDKLPHDLGGKFGSGLLQMFYCTNSEAECEIEGEAYLPFARSTLLRIIDPSAEKTAEIIEIPSTEAIPDYFPAKVITGWTQKDDYPIYEEGGNLGIELEYEEWNVLGRKFPLSADKLAGWPRWIQGIEYPNCPVCGGTMRLVFQIDSEDNLPYMFGDAGCGHITQCEKHFDQVAFGWACS